MRNCLVFGGSGFVGRALVNRLVHEGKDVYVLNRGNHPTPKGARQIIADRNDPNQLKRVLLDRTFDVVYDISAYTPEQTRLAIDYLEGKVDHFVHISSATVYLPSNEYPLTEESPTGFNEIWGEYGKGKYLCERELIRRFNDSHFPMTIFRPFYIYGPENSHDRESYIFRRLANKAPIIIPGMGRPLIQFGYIDDLVEALLCVTGRTEAFGQIYNVADDQALTMYGWVKTCAKALGLEAQIVLVEAKNVGFMPREWFPFRDIHLFGSTSKLFQHLGIRAKYSLLEGLKMTLEKTPKQSLNSFTPSNIELAILKLLKENRIG